MAANRKKAKNPSKVASKGSEQLSLPGVSESMDCEHQEQQDRLDRELVWCIEQLRLGIASNNSTDKQVAEAVRVMRMLESASTPVPKKRMLMKSTFGDYRKKMTDELRQIDAKSKSDASKVSVKPVALCDQRASTFYRKSNASSSACTGGKYRCDVSALRHTSDSAASFTFDFQPDTATHGSDTNTDTSTETSSATNPTDSGIDSASSTTDTAFRLCTSAEGRFLFNFDDR